MQIASSARERYGAPRSASLYTATTSIPRSRQARITRRAISPRLATRMRWNIQLRITDCGLRIRCHSAIGIRQSSLDLLLVSAGGVHAEQDLSVLDRLAVLDQDFPDR